MIVLICLLALASVVAPHWLSSGVFMGIYLFFALILLISAFLIPDLFLKILHIILALLIVSFVTIKSVNARHDITLAEGVEYTLKADGDTLNIKLVDFEVLKSGNEKVPENYVSKLLIDDKDVEVSVNNPYKYKRSRLYQRAYGYDQSFLFIANNDTLGLFPGQNAVFAGEDIKFCEFDAFVGSVAVATGDKLFLLPVGDKSQKYLVLPGRTLEATVLEYVEVKGLVLLYVFAALSIALMIFVRLRGI